MPTDVRTSELVINKLSKQQYESIQNPSPTELYLVPDDDLREHRSYYTTGTAVIDGDTVDVDIMYEGVAPEGSLETDAVWTITTIVATLGGSIVSTTVDTEQTWDFPTPAPVVPVIGTTPPICYPTTASDVKTTSMVVKSSVSDNGKILTENGFVYNTSGNPTINDTKVTCDLGVGRIEKSLSGLSANTTYYIKSYGQNASGISYGGLLTQATRFSILPIEYQEVEFLQSSGTQYINTFVSPSVGSNTTLEVDCMFLSNELNMQIGCGSGSTGLYLITSNDGILRLYIGDTIQSNISSLTRHICKISGNGDGYIDNVLVGSTTSFINSSNYIYLFARDATTMYYAKCNIYQTRIFENNLLIRDMYPCYRISDNKPGMYDIVNNVFYTNQGTGEFTVGPDKEWTDE